ncbi:stage V sporulation protein E [Clostridium sp. P21]|uniref:Probable peptidoglycan glycosyltransferase FtsW n=1 Tax=Clostridium muellerianum TaxID=2716538 RepID=A0A7Y0EDE1_9CLOT|nr:stage V sporulation protein E [Clostridium muellerianum]NMM61419.1 stage V sporulation protein E [Clostridium muellerianum]
MNKPGSKMGPIDFVLFSTVMLLVAVGVIMVYSASSYSAYFNPHIKDSTFYLKKQAGAALVGILFMFITIRMDYHKIKKYTKIIMIVTVVLLLAVFAFKPINGARRWIQIGGLPSIQPSELAKYVVVLYLAKSIENKGEKLKTLLYGVVPYLIISGFYAGMVLAEKNLSIASVIMIVTLIVLYVAGARKSHMFGLMGLVSLAGIAGIAFEPYRLDRFKSFLDPWKDPKGDGYQLIQSLLALGSGGIWGMGLGRSRQKCYYIPEPHNDFIFSIIGEELGLIGCTIIITLFIILIWRGIVTAVRAKDTYGTLLATGITSVIAIQAIINIAVVTGSMPVTGVPLPFISYGGCALAINLMAMGILLNISRQKEYE